MSKGADIYIVKYEPFGKPWPETIGIPSVSLLRVFRAPGRYALRVSHIGNNPIVPCGDEDSDRIGYRHQEGDEGEFWFVSYYESPISFNVSTIQVDARCDLIKEWKSGALKLKKEVK